MGTTSNISQVRANEQKDKDIRVYSLVVFERIYWNWTFHCFSCMMGFCNRVFNEREKIARLRCALLPVAREGRLAYVFNTRRRLCRL